MSAIGEGVAMIPTTPTKIVGGILQIPDISYDAVDFYRNHELNDFGHILADGLGLATERALQVPGIIDDSYQAITGRDFYEDAFDTYIKGIQYLSKPAVESKPITKEQIAKHRSIAGGRPIERNSSSISVKPVKELSNIPTKPSIRDIKGLYTNTSNKAQINLNNFIRKITNNIK